MAKGEVCKTSIRRFESDPRLHLNIRTADRSLGAGARPEFRVDRTSTIDYIEPYI